MKNRSCQLPKNVFDIIPALPFLFAVVLLLAGLVTLNDISLMPSFTIDINVVIVFSVLHLSVVFLLIKWKKISIDLSGFSLVKKMLGISLLLFMLFVMNILLVSGLKMNLNYWLRGKSIEHIELFVMDKYVSYGKGTDYYVQFDSSVGQLSSKVSRSSYKSIQVGSNYNVSVNKGYFEGYFLTEKL